MRGRRRRQEGNVLKGMAAGLVGGLAASLVMNQFQSLWSRLSHGEERSHGAQSLQQGSPDHGAAKELQAEGADKEGMDATERLASVISQDVFDHDLTEREKRAAGTALHYVMGATSGAIYGALAEVVPAVTVGSGAPFGAAVWLVADEGVLPALSLSKSATEYPLSIHVYAFASHLVYGLTTELTRRAVRGAL